METKTTVPEVGALFKEIMEAPERMFELFRIDMKHACEQAVKELIKAELTGFLGREKYQRTSKDGESEKNYRNGSYHRQYTVKNVGTLDIEVARDRLGEFESKLVNKYERFRESNRERYIATVPLPGSPPAGSPLSRSLSLAVRSLQVRFQKSMQNCLPVLKPGAYGPCMSCRSSTCSSTG